MRKNSVLWLSLLAFPLFGYAQEQAQGVITLETAKAVGEELSVTTFCTSINEPVIIDWGDGVLYDRARIWAEQRELVDAGLLRPELALAWYFDLPHETEAELAEIRRRFMGDAGRAQ